MKVLLIFIFLLLFGCQSTIEPNKNLVLVDMPVHPIVAIEPKGFYPTSLVSDLWVDFDFELDNSGRPKNVVVVNSNLSDAFIKKVTEAFKKWLYNKRELDDFQSKRYFVRVGGKQIGTSKSFSGFSCNSAYSCIRK